MKNSTRRWFLVFNFLFLACASEHLSRAELLITPVAVRGQPAPGTSASFQSFLDVQINDSGQVMFIAHLDGADLNSTNRTGMWIGLPGELALAARTGSPAPGYDPGVVFFDLAYPLLAKNGGAAFYARLQGPGISTDAVESGNDDTLWAVVRRKVDAPSGVFPQHAGAGRAGLDGAGEVLELRGTTEKDCFAAKGFALYLGATGRQDQALYYFAWLARHCVFADPKPVATGVSRHSQSTEPFGFALLGPNQAPVAVAFPGDPAPGTQETFSSIDRRSFVSSDQGAVAFSATTSGGKESIWSGTATDLQPIAFSGVPLPASIAREFGPDARWGGIMGFSGLGMNARGELAFNTSILRGSDNLGSFLIAGPPEAPRVAVRFVTPNSTDEGFFAAQRTAMNTAGDVAFVGGVPGLVGNGLALTYQHAPPKLVLAEGRTAPGLREGEVISFLGFGGGPFMNRHGQVVFHAEIGTAVGFQYWTDNGIWLIDPVRGVQLVARGGTQIDLGGGRIVTLAPRSVGFRTRYDDFHSGGEDGRPKPFNDLGQVTFAASWTEANGAFGEGMFIAGEVRVLSGTKAGDDMQISFTTVPGRNYRVEYRDAVESGAWVTLKDSVSGTGGAVIVSDMGAAKLPKRFYRVAVSSTP